MRQGSYPGKRNSQTPQFGMHRVIVPIYVPEISGYFAQLPDILDLTLESLRRSTQGRARVTLIANQCAPQILATLLKEQEKGWLDQLIINQFNRGKIDALRSTLHGCYEDVLTVSDGDVLFHQGWVEAVHQTFCDFPEAASISPSPNPTTAWSNNATTIVDAYLRKELAFRSLVARDDLDRFAASLEHPEFYKEAHYRSQLSAKRNGASACVGNGHFCVSLRREVLDKIPREPTQVALGQESEQATLDLPPERIGGWKLATTKAWVSHLGNIVEPWMHDEFDTICPEPGKELVRLDPLPKFRRSTVGRLPPKLRRALARAVRKRV